MCKSCRRGVLLPKCATHYAQRLCTMATILACSYLMLCLSWTGLLFPLNSNLLSTTFIFCNTSTTVLSLHPVFVVRKHAVFALLSVFLIRAYPKSLPTLFLTALVKSCPPKPLIPMVQLELATFAHRCFASLSLYGAAVSWDTGFIYDRYLRVCEAHSIGDIKHQRKNHDRYKADQR